MKRFLIQKIPKSGQVHLTQDERHHALSVLRLRNGDEVELLDGKGGSVRAKWVKEEGGTAYLKMVGTPQFGEDEGVLPIQLQQSVLKGDAMGWAIEKAVELGARSLQPVIAERTIVRELSKSPEKFVARWQKIADQALKQCGRRTRLEVLPPLKLMDLPLGHELRLAGDEAHAELPAIASEWKSRPEMIHFLVGPEGGWSDFEREWIRSNYRAVSLGPWVLRAETASVFGLSVLGQALRSH